MTCGIYCVENLTNGKKYIGQSVNIEVRINQHLYQLRRGGHENVRLQNSWNKHGESRFTYYIVEKCGEKMLDNLEEFYVDKLGTLSPNGYNLIPGGKSGMRGTKRSTSSRFIGVSKSSSNTWIMQIFGYESKQISIRYKKEIWAAEAYDIIALQVYGEKCKLNFPHRKNEFLEFIEIHMGAGDNFPHGFTYPTNDSFQLMELFQIWHKEVDQSNGGECFADI